MKSIRYVDFNNNTYSITSRSIHYQPMKKEFSSSGFYDGGKEKELPLVETVFNQIMELTQAIIDNKSSHRDKRQMLTAMIYTDSKRLIIARSTTQSELQKYLKEICDL